MRQVQTRFVKRPHDPINTRNAHSFLFHLDSFVLLWIPLTYQNYLLSWTLLQFKMTSPLSFHPEPFWLPPPSCTNADVNTLWFFLNSPSYGEWNGLTKPAIMASYDNTPKTVPVPMEWQRNGEFVKGGRNTLLITINYNPSEKLNFIRNIRYMFRLYIVFVWFI